MIWDIILMSALTNVGFAQDSVNGKAQPVDHVIESNSNVQSARQADISQIKTQDDINQDDIFDDFDINAPFDQSLDIGVEWPDQDNDHQVKDSVIKAEDKTSPPEDISSLVTVATDATEDDIHESAENNAQGTASDQSRIEALKFDDNIDAVQLDQIDKNFVGLSSGGGPHIG